MRPGFPSRAHPAHVALPIFHLHIQVGGLAAGDVTESGHDVYPGDVVAEGSQVERMDMLAASLFQYEPALRRSAGEHPFLFIPEAAKCQSMPRASPSQACWSLFIPGPTPIHMTRQ